MNSCLSQFPYANMLSWFTPILPNLPWKLMATLSFLLCCKGHPYKDIICICICIFLYLSLYLLVGLDQTAPSGSGPLCEVVWGLLGGNLFQKHLLLLLLQTRNCNNCTSSSFKKKKGNLSQEHTAATFNWAATIMYHFWIQG